MKRMSRCAALIVAAALSVSAIGNFSVVQAAEETGVTLAEEFQNVPVEAKVTTRYWLPQAAVEEEELRKDVREFAALGLGGFEVVGFTTLTTGVTDDYQWGTDNWDKAMEVLVDEAKKQGLQVHVTNGPGWPISVPEISDPDDEAAAYELTYGVSSLAAGETYSGAVPMRNTVRDAGTTKLFAVGAYRLTDDKTVDASSYHDLMGYVTVNGEDNTQSTLNWTAPAEGDWQVFSFWEQPSCNKNNSADCYVIDHFGRAGAQACEDYWNEVMQQKDYLGYVTTIFNDSIEYEVDKEWTRGFLEIFKSQKGYDLTPYLPAVGKEGYYNTGVGPNYEFTEDGMADRINNDYEDVLNYCFTEYHLKPLQSMAKNHGIDIRYQVAYNKPLSMETSALYVGVPETEYLVNPSGDDLSAAGKAPGNFLSGRAMSSSIHMTDQKILSAEMTAEFLNAYGQSYEDFAWWAKRGWACGINRQVMHGSSYSGVWDNGELHGAMGDHWPGWQAFSGAMANDFNRNTSVELAKTTVDYISRYNYIMQKDARMDLAFYRDFNNTDYSDSAEAGGVLVNAEGYSFDYVSPGTLNYETAVVTNGVLNQKEAAYKALVLFDQQELEPADAEKILQLAQDGLPVVLVGEKPIKVKNYSNLLDGNTDQTISQITEQLLALDNTREVAHYSELANALKQLGVQADASYHKPVDIIARHQFDQTGEYYYLYNYNQLAKDPENPGASHYPFIDKEASFSEKDVTVTLRGEGRPYLMDGWSGKITPIATYTLGDGSVTLDLHFDEDEAKMIALLTDEQARRNGINVIESHAVSSTAAPDYVDGKLVVKAAGNGEILTTIENGVRISATASGVQQAFEIAEWDLQVRAIRRGETDYFRDSVWEDLSPVKLTELKGWKEINPDWANVSGVGIYTASFDLDSGWKEGYGALIDLGEVEDMFNITVNGITLDPVNQINTIYDIGRYLVKGSNTIRIEVGTTLMNQYKGYGGMNFNPLCDYGLLGTDGAVTVTPYQVLSVEPFDLSKEKEILQQVILYAQEQMVSDEYATVIPMVKDTFEQALADAQRAYDDPAVSQAEIWNAFSALMKEIHKLGFVRGDKTSLGELIETADEFLANIDRYTPATSEPFVEVLSAAKEIYNDGNAMQDDVSKAEDNLLQAMLVLRFKADKSVLESVLKEAALIDTTQFTAETVEAFLVASKEAVAVNSDLDATQQQVDAAAEDLKAAMNNLQAAADVSENLTQVQGDQVLTAGGGNAKTGETGTIAVVVASITLAGAGLMLSKKRK